MDFQREKRGETLEEMPLNLALIIRLNLENLGKIPDIQKELGEVPFPYLLLYKQLTIYLFNIELFSFRHWITYWVYGIRNTVPALKLLVKSGKQTSFCFCFGLVWFF